MKASVEKFLSPAEEQLLVSAIRAAETETSGEIRVHIEPTSSGDINKRILLVFDELNMHETVLRNGVLIYVAVDDREFAIYGDEGINKVVEEDFWDNTKDIIQPQFKKGKFAEGLRQGILAAGKALKEFFPCEPDDIDELPNTISKG